MPNPYYDLVYLEKDIVGYPIWVRSDSDKHGLTLLAELEIEGVSYEKFNFRGTCLDNQPEREVLFQLEIGKPGIRTKIPLMRVDWNPLSGGHKNPKMGVPKKHRRKIIPGSHFHSFELNYLVDEERMREGNLPLAYGIEQPLQSFADLLDFVSKEFRINGIDRIMMPEWVENLL